MAAKRQRLTQSRTQPTFLRNKTSAYAQKRTESQWFVQILTLTSQPLCSSSTAICRERFVQTAIRIVTSLLYSTLLFPILFSTLLNNLYPYLTPTLPLPLPLPCSTQLYSTFPLPSLLLLYLPVCLHLHSWNLCSYLLYSSLIHSSIFYSTLLCSNIRLHLPLV